MDVNNPVFEPTLINGSESWVWQKRLGGKMNASKMRALSNICEVTIGDIIRYVTVRERCGVSVPKGIVTREMV